MAKIENLEIQIKADSSELESGLNKAESKLNNFSKTATKTSNTTQKGFGGIISKGALMPAVVIGATTAIGVALGAMSVGATKSAMEVVESENLVAVTFGNMTGDVVAWSDELQRALGLNAFEVRRNAGVFFNIASSMGMATDNAMTLSKGLTSLAYDMASFYNLNSDEAFTKLRAGLTGETEPLKQLGIIVDETTTKQTAYRLGIAEVNTELDNNQKLMARYMTIMEQTSNAQQDLARTVDSPANQMRIFQNNLQFLSTTFGNIFIPVMNRVLPYLNAIAVLSARALNWLLKLLGIAGIKPMESITANVSNNIGGISSGLNDATKNAKGLKKELLGLAGFDEMNVLGGGSTGAGGVGGGAGIGGGSDFVLPEYDMGLDEVKNRTEEIIGEMTTMWSDFVNNPFVKAIGVIVGAIAGLKVISIVIGFIQGLIAVFNTGAVVATSIAGALKTVGSILLAILTPAVLTITVVFGLAVASAIYWVSVLVDSINGMKQNFGAFKIFMNDIGRLISYYANQFKTNIQSAVSYGRSQFETLKNGVIGSIINMVNGIVSRVSGLRSVFSTLATGIVSLIKLPLNAMIRSLNVALSTISGIRIPDWVPGVGGRGFSMPQVPYLAKGGVIENPTLAMVGEQGREVVMPLENNTGWIDELAGKLNGGSGNGQINLTLQIGTKKVAREIIDLINNESIRTNNLVLKV
jgi:hypothetical protein